MLKRKGIGLLCLLGLLLLSTVADAKIVFGSQRDGVYGIYLMDDDGSNQTLIVEDEVSRPFPLYWSPDGNQILFKGRIKQGVAALFLMNADGTNVRQLPIEDDETGSINGGSFSPDGAYIVFQRDMLINDALESGIYVLNIKTGKMRKISDEWGIQCDWSPDGGHIVFAEPQAFGKNSTIWIMRSDGRNPRPLLPAPVQGEFSIYRLRPRWSPDSKQILFQEEEYKYVPIPNEGNFPVFKAFRYMICDRNGENIRQLQIPEDRRGYGMDWMDDGTSIVFGAQDGIPLNKPLWRGFVFPPTNIYKYHILSEEITPLTNHLGTDNLLDWIDDDLLGVSPVGKKKVTWGTLKQSGSESYRINLISPQ